MRQSNTNQLSSFIINFQTVLKFVVAGKDKAASWNENMRRTLINILQRYNSRVMHWNAILRPAQLTGVFSVFLVVSERTQRLQQDTSTATLLQQELLQWTKHSVFYKFGVQIREETPSKETEKEKRLTTTILCPAAYSNLHVPIIVMLLDGMYKFRTREC